MRPLLTSLLAVWLGVCGGAANAQSWQPPADSQRCPSKWGADDQRGSGNLMKPETVLRATKLIRTGEVIELGQVLSASMPFSNGRVFELHTKRTVMNPGTNRRGSNEEIVFSEIGQEGTQFDGFSHQTIGESLYNCNKLDDIQTRSGFKRRKRDSLMTLTIRSLDFSRSRAVRDWRGERSWIQKRMIPIW